MIVEYFCEKCDYKTKKKGNYNMHIKTEKHLRTYNGDVYTWECECGKKYKYDSGLSRHKKGCNKVNNEGDSSTDGNLTKIVTTLVEENKELRKMIADMIPKIGNNNTNNNTMNNNNNNTFNLQVFLTEDCKDAININDFIEGLKIKVEDLEHTKKYGLCEGIQNIFVNGLKELGTYKRPIHCTDVKRETLYIKDNNDWKKEAQTNETLKKSLDTVAYKQRKEIKEWEAHNPDWNKTEKGTEEWMKICKAVLASFSEDSVSKEKKMIKNIAKNVHIK
jgi:hypothetical protein